MTTHAEHGERQELLQRLHDADTLVASAQAERLQKLYYHDEMAGLAADVYKSAAEEGKPPAGWIRLSESPQHRAEYAAKLGMSEDRLIDFLKPDKSGFRAEIYLPDPKILGPGYEPVVAFKGSANSVKYSNGDLRLSGAEDFLGNNFPQSVGLQTDYYDRAMSLAFVLKRSGIEFDITGHSLGGGMASAAAAVTGYQATTFNAAGLHPLTAQRFAEQNGGISVHDTRRTVTSYQVVDELLNDSLQTALHKMQTQNRDEMAGLIREMTDIASHSPAVRELLKTTLSSQLPAHARESAVEFVDRLSGPQAERLWRDVPMAAGHVEPLLDAKRYAEPGDPSRGIVDRHDWPNMPEMAYLAGPTMQVLRTAAQGARQGEAVGAVAERTADTAAWQMDRSGDLTRRATAAGADVSERATLTAGAVAHHGVQQAGDAIVVARKAAGAAEAALDQAQGTVQREGAQVGARWLRGVGDIDLLPDGLQRWAHARADDVQAAGERAYERNLTEAAQARQEASADGQRIEAFTDNRVYEMDRIVVRASDLQGDAIRGAGELADRTMDTAGAVARIGGDQAKLGATLTGAVAGGLAAQREHLSPLDPKDYPNLMRTSSLPTAAALGGAEAFNRHLMTTVGPSLDARVASEEGQAQTLLQTLGGPKKSKQEEAPEVPREAPPKPSVHVMSDSGHIAHQLYLQAHSAVSRPGFDPDGLLTEHQRGQLAASHVSASVVAGALHYDSGFRAVDHVVPSTKIDPETGAPRYLIAVQGDVESPASRRAPVDLQAALTIPMEQSSEMARTVLQAREQKEAQALTQAMEQNGPGGPTMRIGGLTIAMPSPDSGSGDAGGAGGGGAAGGG